MKELLTLQFSIVAMIAVGFFLKKKHLFGDQGQKNLTDLVIYVVLPCNIFSSFLSGADRSALIDCLMILLISVGIQIFCVLYGKLMFRRAPEPRQKSLRYGTICSNAGFLGTPIAESVFGDVGVMYANVYLIPLRIMMWSEGIAIFSGDKDPKKAFVKVVTHPCVIACALGILVLLTGLKLPVFITTPISTLSRCNTGLTMLVIGMILAGADLKTLVNKTVVLFTIHRLIIIPGLVYLVCLLLPVSHTCRGIAVLLAAMPAGATTGMLASKYDCDPAFASKLVVFSTLCSIPAIMVWSMILK